MREPIPNMSPMDVRNQFLEKQAEKDLAEAFAIVSNKFWWVEDDTYDYEHATPEYERARAIADEWGLLMDEYKGKIIKILLSEGVVVPQHGVMRILEPFMVRNGYQNGNGWWVKREE